MARRTSRGGRRVLERLDAELSEKDEDGAHHISAVLFPSLDDVGFTIPAGGQRRPPREGARRRPLRAVVTVEVHASVHE